MEAIMEEEKKQGDDENEEFQKLKRQLDVYGKEQNCWGKQLRKKSELSGWEW
jgi:hypothetical protein